MRLRADLSQAELAARVGLSAQTISRIERGVLESISVGNLQRLSRGLDAWLNLDLRWQGQDLDQLVDAGHAALEEAAADQLRSAAWDVRAETSFNHFGDRGRVDLLALHRSSATLLVIEAKTRLVDLQDTFGRLDVKLRLANSIVATVGWPAPRRVVPCLLVADGRTAWRVLAEHRQLFARFDLRGPQLRAWLRDPRRAAPEGLLWFQPLPDSLSVRVIRSRRGRRLPTAHGR